MGMVNKNGIGALSFGVSVGRNKVAYPTSPTWMLYTGNEDKCHDDIPVLIRREVFCSSYFAEARIFRTYHSWTLAMMLSQVDTFCTRSSPRPGGISALLCCHKMV